MCSGTDPRRPGELRDAFVRVEFLWHHMAWIATDPNVEISEVLPCHTTDGEWDPARGRKARHSRLDVM